MTDRDEKPVEIDIEVVCPACGDKVAIPRMRLSTVTRYRCKRCETVFSFADQNAAIAKMQDDYRLARDPDSEDSILIV